MGLMEGRTLDVMDVMDEVRLVIYIYSCSSCYTWCTHYIFFHVMHSSCDAQCQAKLATFLNKFVCVQIMVECAVVLEVSNFY